MTKHTGMYPRTRAADNDYTSTDKKDDSLQMTPMGIAPHQALGNNQALKDIKCLCEARYKDEE